MSLVIRVSSDRRGELAAQGTPEEIAKVEASYTELFLKGHLPKTK